MVNDYSSRDKCAYDHPLIVYFKTAWWEETDVSEAIRYIHASTVFKNVYNTYFLIKLDYYDGSLGDWLYKEIVDVTIEKFLLNLESDQNAPRTVLVRTKYDLLLHQ
jgi:hypothetical protein